MMNSEHFWRLLEPEHPAAEAFCRRLTGSRDEGDDLYQDALVRAIEKFTSLRDQRAFRPWLYRIMINTYRNRYRQPWWRRRQELAEPMFEAARVDNPSHRYDARRWLRRAFRALTPAQRALVILHEIEGWSTGDLAQLCQRPDGTVKARLSRARRLMRRALERSPDAEDETNESEADYAIPRKRPALE